MTECNGLVRPELMNSPGQKAITKYWLIALALLAIVACTTTKQPPLEVANTYIVVRPSANVSLEEGKQLESTLTTFDKDLYRIQEFTDGKPTKTYGRMDEQFIRDGLVSEIYKEAARDRFNGFSMIAGHSSTRQGSPLGQPIPPPPPGDLEASKRIIPKLRPALEKYQGP